MRTRALGWAIVLLGLAVGAVRGDEPKPGAPAPITWSDADARVAKGDAPLYLQVHITADGRVALRSTPGGVKPLWSAHCSWQLSVDDLNASMEALRALHGALVEVLGARDKAGPLRDESRHSRARLLVDPHPSALWRYAQWVVATAASPQLKVYHFAFSMLQPGVWLDNELPRDNEDRFEPATVKPEATLLVVKLFRENLERPEVQRFTKLRLTREPGMLAGGMETEEAGVAGDPDAKPAPEFLVEFPAGDAPSGLHAARWRLVETHIRTLAATGLPSLGEVRTPFPKGLGVPYADVAAVLDLLQRLGCKRTTLEGAPPPLLRKEGGGWAFDK
jgi:hypothetical protein